MSAMEGVSNATEEPPCDTLPEQELTDKEEQVREENPSPESDPPTYLTMIKDAVLALNESEGVSKEAILRYLAQHYPLGENSPKINSQLSMALMKALKDSGAEEEMIRAAEQSANMRGMFDEKGEFPSSNTEPPHKLTERKKRILDKNNPIPGPHHPTYLTMIKGAVLALNESKGASKGAILKYLAQHYQLGENLPKINTHLCTALKKATNEGKIEQTKGHGASGSFKMGASSSKKKVPSKKKVAPTIAKKSSAAKTVAPKAKRVIGKKKPVAKAKVTKPKVPTKAAKKLKVKKIIKKKAAKKAIPIGKLRVTKKRIASKSKAPRAKKA
ncbi:H15 domain-containing protein [Trichostrongylus colubriformis]|uniref:H15 domain-containing protein n=1 Tax=Trichostrongylus colubriformis TaxID=6319 RepID=A0AAN8ITV3_TRICO